MITRTFTNELGREITINVRDVMGDRPGLEDAIQLDIFSDESQDEWTITDWEARTLLTCLKERFESRH